MSHLCVSSFIYFPLLGVPSHKRDLDKAIIFGVNRTILPSHIEMCVDVFEEGIE